MISAFFIGFFKMINIKRAVSEGRKVRFAYYRDSSLWYRTEFDEIFPVPVSDIGNATFNAEDKALLFMRYMRKWNEKSVFIEGYFTDKINKGEVPPSLKDLKEGK